MNINNNWRAGKSAFNLIKNEYLAIIFENKIKQKNCLEEMKLFN